MGHIPITIITEARIARKYIAGGGFGVCGVGCPNLLSANVGEFVYL
jgi:hypothetical protein